MTGVWLAAAASLFLISVASNAQAQGLGVDMRAVVIAPDNAREVRAVDALRPATIEQIQTPDNRTEIWLVPADQSAQLANQLLLPLDRHDITVSRQDYRSVLAPIPESEITGGQQRTAAELEEAYGGRVTLLRSQPALLLDHAFSAGFGRAQGFAEERSFRIDLGAGLRFDLTNRSGAVAAPNPDNPVWSGANETTFANLIYTRGVISGVLQTPDAAVELLPVGDGIYAAVQTDYSALAETTNDIAQDAGGVLPGHAPRADCTSENPCEIDIAVAFTPEAMQLPNADSADERTKAARDQIDLLNAALSNANLADRVHFNLCRDTTYRLQQHQAAGVGAEWRVIRSNPSHEALNVRQSCGADIVVVVAHWKSDALNGQAGGVSFDRVDDAFVVVRITAFAALSFQHEIGHLLGFAHDRRTYIIQRCGPPDGQSPPRCSGFPAIPEFADFETNAAFWDAYLPFLRSVDQYCLSHHCPAPSSAEGPSLGYCVPQTQGQDSFQESTLMAYPDNCNGARRQLYWSSIEQKTSNDMARGEAQFANEWSILPARARYVAAHSEYDLPPNHH